MERFFAIAKLTAIAVAIVVAILCLGYSNAYGFTTSMQLTKPSGQSQPLPGPTGTIADTHFDMSDVGSDFDGNNDADEKTTCPPIPEPTTLILLGVGLAGIKLLKRRN